MPFRPSAFVALLLVCSSPAFAQKIHSPYVEKGEWEIESHGSYSHDWDSSGDRRFKNKFGIGYGLTEDWKVELEGEIKETGDQDLVYEATEIVNKFQFWPKGTKLLDMGVYTAFEIPAHENEPYKLEAKLLGAKELTHWRHRANLIFEQEIGEHREHELELEFAWQSFYQFSPDLKGGAEYYASFGEIGNMGGYDGQSHQLGPVFKYHLPNTETEVAFGYLFGISGGAPDGALKWEFEMAF